MNRIRKGEKNLEVQKVYFYRNVKKRLIIFDKGIKKYEKTNMDIE